MRRDNTLDVQRVIDSMVRRPCTVAELVAIGHVSSRTIYRWLRSLPAAGIELVRIRNEDGPWRYKITKRPTQVPNAPTGEK